MGGGSGNKTGYKGDDAENMCGSNLEPDPRYDQCCSNIFRPGKVLRDVVVGFLVVLAIAVVIAVLFVVCFYLLPANEESTLELEESAFVGKPIEEEKNLNEVELTDDTRYDVRPDIVLESIRKDEGLLELDHEERRHEERHHVGPTPKSEDGSEPEPESEPSPEPEGTPDHDHNMAMDHDMAHDHEGDMAHDHESDMAHGHMGDMEHGQEGDMTHGHEGDMTHEHIVPEDVMLHKEEAEDEMIMHKDDMPMEELSHDHSHHHEEMPQDQIHRDEVPTVQIHTDDMHHSHMNTDETHMEEMPHDHMHTGDMSHDEMHEHGIPHDHMHPESEMNKETMMAGDHLNVDGTGEGAFAPSVSTNEEAIEVVGSPDFDLPTERTVVSVSSISGQEETVNSFESTPPEVDVGSATFAPSFEDFGSVIDEVTAPEQLSPLNTFVNPAVVSEGSTETCRLRRLEMCRDLPYNYTSLPNWANDQNDKELTEGSLPFFRDVIVRSGCSPRALQYSCGILEPPCNADGSIVPPCRTFCKSVAATCQEFIISGFSLSDVFNCEKFPDSNDPNVCFDMTQDFSPVVSPTHFPSDLETHTEFSSGFDKAFTGLPEEIIFEGTTIMPVEEEQQTTVTSEGCPELQCLDGTCLALAQLNDGVNDCPDGTDEQDFGSLFKR